MFKKKVLISFVILIILATVANAKIITTRIEIPDFEIAAVPINDQVYPGDRAIFNLTITNNQEFDDKFKLVMPFGQWGAQTDPLYYGLTGFNLKPNQSQSMLILLSPREIPFGHYAIDIVVESVTTKQTVVQYLNVYYTSNEALYRDYPLTVNVETKLSSDGRFDPRTTQTIEVTVKNRNPKNITDLIVAVKGQYFDEKKTITVPGFSSAVARFDIKLDPKTPPTKDTALILVVFGEESIGGTPLRIPYEVIGYNNVNRDVSEVKGFLKSKTAINIQNFGNDRSIEEVKLKFSRGKLLFTKADPRPSVLKEEGKTYLTWSIVLEPGETKTITIFTSYMWLFITFLFCIFGLIIAYLARSPIIVTKTAKAYEGGEGIQKLRVTIHIRNRSGKPYKNVTIIDHVPKLISVDQKTDLGTMKPSKVLMHESKGTLVMWELENLEEYEERIFSYIAKSKLAILGGLTLPITIVKFKQGNKERAVTTKKVILE